MFVASKLAYFNLLFSMPFLDLSAKAMEMNINVSSPGRPKDVRRSPEKRDKRSRAVELPTLKPLPMSIAFDMR